MPAGPGESLLTTLFADVHYYFSPPGSKPAHHRFDRGSYLYLFQHVQHRQARLEIANHAGTADQDFFAGPLSAVKVQYSHLQPTLFTVVVLASGGAPDPSAWHLPGFDARNEQQYLYPLHALDAYLWTEKDAGTLLSHLRTVLGPGQLEVKNAPAASGVGRAGMPIEHRDSMSPVVQQLEKTAISSPFPARTTSAMSAQSLPGPPTPAPSGGEGVAGQAPLAYNPAAPAAPEPVTYREKTPPPLDDGTGTGLKNAARYDAGVLPPTMQYTGAPPVGPTQYVAAQSGGRMHYVSSPPVGPTQYAAAPPIEAAQGSTQTTPQSAYFGEVVQQHASSASQSSLPGAAGVASVTSPAPHPHPHPQPQPQPQPQQQVPRQPSFGPLAQSTLPGGMGGNSASLPPQQQQTQYAHSSYAPPSFSSSSLPANAQFLQHTLSQATPSPQAVQQPYMQQQQQQQEVPIGGYSNYSYAASPQPLSSVSPQQQGSDVNAHGGYVGDMHSQVYRPTEAESATMSKSKRGRLADGTGPKVADSFGNLESKMGRYLNKLDKLW